MYIYRKQNLSYMEETLDAIIDMNQANNMKTWVNRKRNGTATIKTIFNQIEVCNFISKSTRVIWQEIQKVTCTNNRTSYHIIKFDRLSQKTNKQKINDLHSPNNFCWLLNRFNTFMDYSGKNAHIIRNPLQRTRNRDRIGVITFKTTQTTI